MAGPDSDRPHPPGGSPPHGAQGARRWERGATLRATAEVAQLQELRVETMKGIVTTVPRGEAQIKVAYLTNNQVGIQRVERGMELGS